MLNSRAALLCPMPLQLMWATALSWIQDFSSSCLFRLSCVLRNAICRGNRKMILIRGILYRTGASVHTHQLLPFIFTFGQGSLHRIQLVLVPDGEGVPLLSKSKIVVHSFPQNTFHSPRSFIVQIRQETVIRAGSVLHLGLPQCSCFAHWPRVLAAWDLLVHVWPPKGSSRVQINPRTRIGERKWDSLGHLIHDEVSRLQTEVSRRK